MYAGPLVAWRGASGGPFRVDFDNVNVGNPKRSHFYTQLAPRHAGCSLCHAPPPLIALDHPSIPTPSHSAMSFHGQQPHGGPAGAPPNMAQSFNAMLQRSVHEPAQPDAAIEAPGRPSSSIGEFLRSPMRRGVVIVADASTRRLWGRLQCHTTTTTRIECARWSTGSSSAGLAFRSSSTGLLDLRNALGHGRQYGLASHAQPYKGTRLTHSRKGRYPPP